MNHQLDAEKKKQLVDKLVLIVGDEYVVLQDTDLILNAQAAWPLSQAKLRAGEMLPLADLVVFPASSTEVSQILVVANDYDASTNQSKVVTD